MKTYTFQQGSEPWKELRFSHRTASEAPAMMGASKKVTRSELLHAKATGNVREFSEWVQSNLLDRGHEIEALTRPMAEAELGEDLYPGTFATDDDYMLASPDGVTMAGNVGWENKSWNKELVAMVKAKELSPEYYWQLEHQADVAELDEILFTVSDGTPENYVSMIYVPLPERRAQLRAAWKQFDEDLANFKHVEALPSEPGTALMALPTLSVKLIGEVTESNLALYKSRSMAFIEGIKTDLNTDQDFATAELTVKFCGDAEKELDTVKAMALEQTASIAELFRTVDQIKDAMRGKRLFIEKLVAARKDSIRVEIRQEGIDQVAQHARTLAKRIAPALMPAVASDFASVMKGKKTVKSLRDAVSTEVARVKIAANEIADRIEINQRQFRVVAADHLFLFADQNALLLKPADDFLAAVKLRISEHQAQKEREEQATRDRIRNEETARLAAEEDARKRALSLADATPHVSVNVAPNAAVPQAPTPGGFVTVGGGRNPFTQPVVAQPVAEWDVEITDRSALLQFLSANEDFAVSWVDFQMGPIALYARLSNGSAIPGLKFTAPVAQAA